MLTKFKPDQAEGLRQRVRPRPVTALAVPRGPGGVGKTNTSVNLAIALAQSGNQVTLLDADFGLANVVVLLGLWSSYTLADVMSGARTLEEIVLDGPGGFKIIPASSGIQRMANLTPVEHAGLIRAFSEHNHRIDVLLIDTAAGNADNVLGYNRAAQEVIVVVCDEPTTNTNTNTTNKKQKQKQSVHRF